MKSPQIDILFNTEALMISGADKPFWYTSGELGPYYINTHFVCGGRAKAIELLDLITVEAGTPKTLPAKILSELEAVYESYESFRAVIDGICNCIRHDLPLDKINGISGGQRRDWFFAPIVAKQLGLPCLYLYNDGRAYDEYGDPVDTLHGKTFVNVCDLLRVGSSYTSKWIPIIENLGGKLIYSVSVVDRCEGGRENILAAGVEESLSLFSLNRDFFKKAQDKGVLEQKQFELLSEYLDNPRGAIREFLVANPSFLQDALNSSDEKIQKRANSLIENDYYQLNLKDQKGE